MSQLILKNITSLGPILPVDVLLLKANQMDTWRDIEDAFLIIDNGLIKDFGKMSDFSIDNYSCNQVIDVSGKFVLPAFCDSHTHLVFHEYREKEFTQRIAGATYQEIANQGGGILNSAKKIAVASESELFDSAYLRLQEVIKTGTGAIEIKSGYGLTLAAELKILRVANQLKKHTQATIVTTFLGAHAIPEKYKKEPAKYIDLITEKMIPQVAEEGLASFIDVFCETGYFTPEQTEKIIVKALDFGLKPKIHTNQFTSIGGIQVAVKHNALSVDHLEVMTTNDYQTLKNSATMPCLLPGCSFFLGIPYAPAKELLKNDIPFSLATDFNPGSCPSGNMLFVNSLACIKQKLTSYQAMNASLINGAYAMKLSQTHGSITKGKYANLIITKKIPSISYLSYSFGEGRNLIDKVILKGVLQ